MRNIDKLARKLALDKSGNAAMIMALALPSIIGGSGFAIDISQWYMWKREMQHAVDQGAYAGAWALARPESAGFYEARATQEFDANSGITKDFISRPNIRVADYAGGTLNSVVLTATATRPLPFSFMLTGKATTVFVSAQASFKGGQDFKACLTSTATDGTGTSIGGNATVNARCGIAALSCSDGAIEIDGSATLLTDSIVACGTIIADPNMDTDGDPTTVDNVSYEGEKGLQDPFAGIEPVLDNRPRNDNCGGKGNNKLASLQPGTYTSLVVKCRTVLSSGIYVINGGVLDLSANYDVTGRGVQFVLRNGATIILGGSGNSNKLNLTPPTAAELARTPAASKANELEGFLIIEDKNNNPPEPGHILNGNSDSVLEGNIYLPSGTLRVNGTANVVAQCLQIAAYRITVGGNAYLETLCPSLKTNSVGGSLADVRLVA